MPSTKGILTPGTNLVRLRPLPDVVPFRRIKEAAQKVVPGDDRVVCDTEKSNPFVTFAICLRRLVLGHDLIENIGRSVTLVWL